MSALEGRARLDPNRLPRGRSYARSGAVGELSVAAGQVSAAVQGSRARPYQVRVRVREFAAAEWDRLLDVVAAQVGRAAALLDGELPPEVLDDVASAGLELLPGPGELQPRCSCPDWADPCKHAAAVCYLVADALDADPFALLLLRGHSREAVLAGLRARRTSGPADATEEPGGDRGVPAVTAYGNADRPRLPAVPMPPPRPGPPAVLAADPPVGSGIDPVVLRELAADASARAWELALGDDGGLGLDRDADLARRADRLIGSPAFEELARRAGVPGRDLLRRALAWRYGGFGGLDALSATWQPTPSELREGRLALGESARAWRNRLTRHDWQLRLGRDGGWYPYRRSIDGWDPAGPPSADPGEAVGALGPGERGRQAQPSTRDRRPQRR